MTIYEMVKDSARFKAFCRPRVCTPIVHKAFKPVGIKIPNRKGKLSMLGEYSTGRLLANCHGTYTEVLTLKRVYDPEEGAYIVRSTEPSAEHEVAQGVADYFVKPGPDAVLCPDCSRALSSIDFIESGYTCRNCKKDYFIRKAG